MARFSRQVGQPGLKLRLARDARSRQGPRGEFVKDR
jgi:hypothetical protein